jgi:hypothetical protein
MSLEIMNYEYGVITIEHFLFYRALSTSEKDNDQAARKDSIFLSAVPVSSNSLSSS